MYSRHTPIYTIIYARQSSKWQKRRGGWNSPSHIHMVGGGGDRRGWQTSVTSGNERLCTSVRVVGKNRLLHWVALPAIRILVVKGEVTYIWLLNDLIFSWWHWCHDYSTFMAAIFSKGSQACKHVCELGRRKVPHPLRHWQEPPAPTYSLPSLKLKSKYLYVKSSHLIRNTLYSKEKQFGKYMSGFLQRYIYIFSFYWND